MAAGRTPMIEQVALVHRVEAGGRIAWVIPRGGTCGAQNACGSGATVGGCGHGLLAQALGRPVRPVAVDNVVGARSGDRVVLGIDPGTLMLGSAVAYLVPVGGLILGAWCGQALGLRLTPAATELLAAIGGGLGLAVALLGVRRFGRARADVEQYRPRMLRRLMGAAVE